jgi:Protein of unknown function (DUF2568)
MIVGAALAFFVELAALLGTALLVAHWAHGPWRWPLGLLAAALFATAWGIWAAPRSSRRLAGQALLVFKLAAFGLGAVGVALSHHWLTGAALFVLALLSLALMPDHDPVGPGGRGR